MSTQLKQPLQRIQSREDTLRPRCSQVVRRRNGRETPCSGYGSWIVCIDMRERSGKTLFRSRTPLLVCFRHRKTIKVCDVVNERTWKSICLQLKSQGLPVPSRNLTTLGFEKKPT